MTDSLLDERGSTVILSDAELEAIAEAGVAWCNEAEFAQIVNEVKASRKLAAMAVEEEAEAVFYARIARRGTAEKVPLHTLRDDLIAAANNYAAKLEAERDALQAEYQALHAEYEAAIRVLRLAGER